MSINQIGLTVVSLVFLTTISLSSCVTEDLQQRHTPAQDSLSLR